MRNSLAAAATEGSHVVHVPLLSPEKSKPEMRRVKGEGICAPRWL